MISMCVYMCLCVSVCTYLSDIHCFSVTVRPMVYGHTYVLCMCTCVCVCVSKGGVYFNIVSQESIYRILFPHLPLIFLLPMSYLAILLSTGKQPFRPALCLLNMVLLCVTYQCLAMSLMLVTFMASIAPEGPQILARRQTRNSVNFVRLIKPH